MSETTKILERLKKISYTPEEIEQQTNSLSIFQNQEYKTIENGKLKRIGKNIEDLIANFIYQLGTNINNLPKDQKLDVLDKTKNDLLSSLEKVIV
mgnify:CR=1 FL=1